MYLINTYNQNTKLLYMKNLTQTSLTLFKETGPCPEFVDFFFSGVD
jgi:hypothetical protein